MCKAEVKIAFANLSGFISKGWATPSAGDISTNCSANENDVKFCKQNARNLEILLKSYKTLAVLLQKTLLKYM